MPRVDCAWVRTTSSEQVLVNERRSPGSHTVWVTLPSGDFACNLYSPINADPASFPFPLSPSWFWFHWLLTLLGPLALAYLAMYIPLLICPMKLIAELRVPAWLVRAHFQMIDFLLHPHRVVGSRELCGFSFISALIPFERAPPL